MSEALSKTLHGDFDSVFYEVTQPEKVAWTTDGQLRLFHLNTQTSHIKNGNRSLKNQYFSLQNSFQATP